MDGFQSFPAPAKLNLYLSILGRRADGYHLLDTEFELLDVGDTVRLRVRADGVIQRAAPNAISEAEDLTVRAAHLLQRRTGSKCGVDIVLEKTLPVGAGLGGGSSDAATTLLALNKLWGTRLTRIELMRLSVELGADVPFFIFGERARASGIGERLVASASGIGERLVASASGIGERLVASASGIGERLVASASGIGEQLRSAPAAQAWYVVLDPRVSVSTREAFAWFDLTHAAPNGKMASLSQEGVAGKAGNDLESVVCARYPEVMRHLSWLKRFGDARMTGSGSCVFLACDDQASAQRIFTQRPRNTVGFVARALAHHPLKELC